MKRAGAAPWNDTAMESQMSGLLHAGVLLSALVVSCGGLLYLIHYGGAPPHHGVFRGEPAGLRTVRGIAGDAFRGGSRGIIQAGLLVLIATPVARVAFAAYAFAREGDRLYVGISLIVLAILLYSLASSFIRW